VLPDRRHRLVSAQAPVGTDIARQVTDAVVALLLVAQPCPEALLRHSAKVPRARRDRTLSRSRRELAGKLPGPPDRRDRGQWPFGGKPDGLVEQAAGYRLGRSLPHLLATIEQLSERGIGFESVHDKVDTTSATGRLVLHILAALSQFERELTKERIAAGLASARARNRKLGRPSVLNEERLIDIREALASGRSISQVARSMRISRATLYRHQLVG